MSTLKIYAIRDRKASVYHKPMFVPHLAVLQRDLVDVTKDPNTMLAKHPSFMKLPAKTRSRFHNDTNELVEFISDEKNYDEAVELGFISEESIEEKAQESGTIKTNDKPVHILNIQDLKEENTDV